MIYFDYVNYKNLETGDFMCRVRNYFMHTPESILYLPSTSYSILVGTKGT